VIFKRVITDPHASWFREAYYRFWPEWWLYPNGRDPGPTTSVFDVVLLRAEVWPGSPPRTVLGWDNMGRTALIYLDTTVTDKRAFCEQVIHELLSLFIAAFLEQYPPLSYLTPEESEARITRCCELFGQPRSAWNSGVREAVIQTIKEHCADPALLKTPGSTSSITLQAMPLMPVGYVHPDPPPFGYDTPAPRWITVPGEPNYGASKPRYSPVNDWWGGFGSRYGYDKLPALGAPASYSFRDQELKDSLYYDVNPGRAWLIPFGYYGGGGFAFPELIPPEWRELLDLLAAPPGIAPTADSTWPTDRSYLDYRHDPLSIAVVWEGGFYPVGNGAFLGTGFSGGQDATFIIPGEVLQPDIPWGSNLGYIADQIYWQLESLTIPGHWFVGEGYAGAAALHGDWFWREEYAVTWDSIEMHVLDRFGQPLASGGGVPGDPGLSEVVSITAHDAGVGVGAFDNDRLPVSAVIARVTVSGIWSYDAPTTNAVGEDGNMVDPSWPHWREFGPGTVDMPFYPGGGVEPGSYDPSADPGGALLMSDQQLLAKEIIQIQFTTGNMGIYTIRAYATPMEGETLLIPSTPPWPGTARFPGDIAVGPGVRGSHPTVKGLRGGRVSGAHRQWPI
jgi:hypothetical protein